MSLQMMTLAAITNSTSGFETGVENYIQEVLGVTGRWTSLFPNWDSHSAMKEFKADALVFADKMGKELKV